MHNSSSSNSRDVPAAGSFRSFAVGRRFHPTVKVEAGQKACLQHQAGNAKDPNALMVVSCEEPGQVLGYLPATIAAILVSIVKDSAADIAVTVLERPKTPKASLPITVQVGFQEFPRENQTLASAEGPIDLLQVASCCQLPLISDDINLYAYRWTLHLLRAFPSAAA